jgi:cell division protein ZapA
VSPPEDNSAGAPGGRFQLVWIQFLQSWNKSKGDRLPFAQLRVKSLLNLKRVLASIGGTTQNRRAQQGAHRMSNRVKVEIYGQSYTLSGDLDEAYVQKLARYVDEKLRAVSEATQTVDSMRVAVLAAMAIADELHTRQHDTGHRDEALRERAQQCLTILERALNQTT